MIQILQADFIIWSCYFSVIKKQDIKANYIGFDPTVTIMGMH